MKTWLTAFLFFLITTQLSFGQDFNSHKWNDRILIILADSPNNKTFKKQFDQLLQVQKGLKDRKLVIYLFTPSGQNCDLQLLNFVSNTQRYSDLKKFKNDFEILLVGLDGGIKLHQNTLLPAQQLFDRIDAMPMRAQELRKN